jgi:hypothetical protein
MFIAKLLARLTLFTLTTRTTPNNIVTSILPVVADDIAKPFH